MEIVGNNIKKIRLERRMKQKDLAKALGISIAAVSKIESSATNLSLIRLMQIAKLYKVQISELLSEARCPTRESIEVIELKDQIRRYKKEVRELREKLIVLYGQCLKDI